MLLTFSFARATTTIMMTIPRSCIPFGHPVFGSKHLPRTIAFLFYYQRKKYSKWHLAKRKKLSTAHLWLGEPIMYRAAPLSSVAHPPLPPSRSHTHERGSMSMRKPTYTHQLKEILSFATFLRAGQKANRNVQPHLAIIESGCHGNTLLCRLALGLLGAGWPLQCSTVGGS